MVRAWDTLIMLTLRRAEGREFFIRPGNWHGFPHLNMPFLPNSKFIENIVLAGKQKLQSISTFLYNIEVASHVEKTAIPAIYYYYIYLFSDITFELVIILFVVHTCTFSINYIVSHIWCTLYQFTREVDTNVINLPQPRDNGPCTVTITVFTLQMELVSKRLHNMYVHTRSRSLWTGR